MPKRYELKKGFAHTFDGDTRPTYFTRDNQHLLGKLPDKALNDKIKRGLVLEHDLTAAEARQLDAAAEATPAKETTTGKGGRK